MRPITAEGDAIAAVDYSVLDDPEVSGRTFHPLRGWSDTPDEGFSDWLDTVHGKPGGVPTCEP